MMMGFLGFLLLVKLKACKWLCLFAGGCLPRDVSRAQGEVCSGG